LGNYREAVMKYLALPFTTFLLFQFTLLAQAPVIEWTKTYGGVEYEDVRSVYQTSDGGYIIGGSTSSFGEGLYDPYLFKIDDQGDSIWFQTYGLSHLSESIECFQKTEDGGYIMVGNSGSSSIDSQIYLLKIRSNYDLDWVEYHGADSLDEVCSWVEQTDEGNYVTTGYYWAPVTQNDFFLIVYDQVGLGLSVRKFSWYYADRSNCVKQTTDGGYIITGSTASINTLHDKDVFLMKTDIAGDTVWTQTYGGSEYDEGHYVHQTSDGGFIIVGLTESFSAVMSDIYIIRTDPIGNSLWTKLYGGIFGDGANYILEDTDGNFIITGTLSWDAFAMKIDTNGDSLWTKKWGGPQSESSVSIQHTADGGYIVGGLTTSYGAGRADIYITKFSSETTGNDEASNNQIPWKFALFQNYPNPFNSNTTINYYVPGLSFVTLKIYDVLGNEIATLVNEEKSVGSYQAEFNATNLPSGIYFYRLQAGSFVETKKMVLMK
jgi:hypothetical protein